MTSSKKGQGKAKAPEDIGWQHCIITDAASKRVQCLYCGKPMSSGVSRLKQHLAGIPGDVAACTQVSVEVRREMLNFLRDKKRQKDVSTQRDQMVREELSRFGEEAETVGSESHSDESSNEGDDEEIQMRKAIKSSKRSFARDESRRKGEGSSAGLRSASVRIQEEAPVGMGRRSSSVRVSDSASRGVDPERPSKHQTFFHKKQGSKQPRIKTALKGVKNAKEMIGKAISRWFYYSHIPFNAASNDHFKNMVSAIQESGSGIAPPTAYEISNTYLQEEYELTMAYLKTLHCFWDEFGCTLMCDGWTTSTRRQIINFLVYNPQGTIFLKSVDATEHVKSAKYIFKQMDDIVEEIGESRFVQVVTDNGANFKSAGQMLMQKRKKLFWTPCAAHCIDLMLEDTVIENEIHNTIQQGRAITNFIYNHGWALTLMRKETGNKELIRPGITRFATHFISIQSIFLQCDALRRMCCAEDWGVKVHKMKRKDKEIAHNVKRILMGDEFWKGEGFCINIFEPLVKVLRLIDLDDHAQMGFLYESMDRAKEQIRTNLGKHGSYAKWWNIIDYRWDHTLHKDLHAAGFFLNPRFQYKENVRVDREVMRGLQNVLNRLEPDLIKRVDIDNEVEKYRRKDGEFGTARALIAINRSNPADWWTRYGWDAAPNLTPIAVRILSQTTSSSHCERNWSTFSLIHTKTRNRLSTQKLEKLVFIHYNIRLRERQLRRNVTENLIDLDDIFDDEDPMVDWIRETEPPALDGQENPWDEELGSTQPRAHPQVQAAQQPQGPQPQAQKRTRSQREETRTSSDESDDDHSPPTSGGDIGAGGGSRAGELGGSSSRYPTDSQSYWRVRDDTRDSDYGGTYLPSTYDHSRDVGQQEAIEPSDSLSGQHQAYDIDSHSFIPGLSGGSTLVGYRGPYPCYTELGTYGVANVEDSSSNYDSYAYGGYGSYGDRGGGAAGATFDSSSSSGVPQAQIGPLDSMMASFFLDTNALYHHYYRRDREDDDDEQQMLREPARNSTWY